MDTPDFLPERIRETRDRRRRWIRHIYLLLMVAGCLVAWGVVGQRDVDRAKEELTMLQGRTDGLTEQLDLKARLQAQLQDLLVKQRISSELGSRVNVLDLANELEQLLPTSMFLVSLSLDTIEIQPPRVAARPRSAGAGASRLIAAPAEKRVQITLTGLAPDDVTVANFIGQLSADPLFEDVNMGYTRSAVYQGRTASQFQASCYVAR